MKERFNGSGPTCSIMNGEWEQHREEISDMQRQIEATHVMVDTLASNSQHLVKLDTIANAITEMKDHLVAAATGRNQIPMDVAKELFTHTQKSSNTLTRAYGFVVVSLLAIVVFLLTGEHFGWIRKLVEP